MDKLDNWAEDKRAGLKVELKDLDDRIKELKRQMRQVSQTGNLPDNPALRKKTRKPEQKRDEARRDHDAAASQVEVRKDMLPVRWRNDCGGRSPTGSRSHSRRYRGRLWGNRIYAFMSW